MKTSLAKLKQRPARLMPNGDVDLGLNQGGARSRTEVRRARTTPSQAERPSQAASTEPVSAVVGLLVVALSGCTSTGIAGLSAANHVDAGPIDSDTPSDGCVDASGCLEDEVCAADGSCVECTQDDDCSADDRSVCDVASGLCVECTGDAQCTDAEHSRCAPWGACGRPCSDDLGCDSEERCAPDGGVCVECLGDADCSEGPGSCHPERMECAECLDDLDCEADGDTCVAGECVDSEGGL